jgi:hypothetical protein
MRTEKSSKFLSKVRNLSNLVSKADLLESAPI